MQNTPVTSRRAFYDIKGLAFAGLTALFVVASTICLHAASFSDDNWTGLSGYPGANGPVSSTVVDGAGNLYIGGSFDVVGKMQASRIAKWDGSHWSPLGSGLQWSNGWGGVYALAVSGGDLYAAGRFTSAGGVAANNIAKWNGTNWSALGSGIGGSNNSAGYVYGLAASGSDVYAAGDFTTAGGSTAHRIAKWNGSSWSALGAGPEIPQFSAALAVSGSDLYVGTDSGVAKWNGSSWSALGSGLTNGVGALAVSGSDVYAVGYPTNVFKWNGSSWSALDSTVGSGFSYPWALTVSGGDLYAGGNLITYHTSNSFGYRAYVAKWTGNSWVELGLGITEEWGESWDEDVRSLAVFGTNVYAGGAFRRAGEVKAYCIAKWNGIRWSALDSTYRHLTAVTASGRDVYGAGTFAAADNSQSNGVAKWNGHGWSALGGEFQSVYSFGTVVSALAVSGRDVYAGGSFTNAGGTPANNIAKWNGTNWSALGSGLALTNYDETTVHALAVSGHDLYVGGHFSLAGGLAANNIAKWDGNNWSALGSGIGPWLNGPATVYALAVSGSNLYAGGIFTVAGGNPANYIAKWDGNNWSALGSGMDDAGHPPAYVTSLAVMGSDLFAGGGFTTAGGVFVRCVAKWNGSSWSSLHYGMTAAGWTPGGESSTTPYVHALTVSGGDLYVGGVFNTAGGADANYVAKWNGKGWLALGSGMNYGVKLLAATDDELFAAGVFTTAGGKIAPSLARTRIGSKAQGMTVANPTRSIRFSGVTGYPYDVQRATSLTPPVTWTTVSAAPLHPTPDGSFTFTDSNAPPGTAFYRAAGPELDPCSRLSLQQPAGTDLTNGYSGNPPRVPIGEAVIGGRATNTFTIVNRGDVPMTIDGVSMDNGGTFEVNDTGMLTTVPAGGSTTFTVTFYPWKLGEHADELLVATYVLEGCYDPNNGYFRVIVTGIGL